MPARKYKSTCKVECNTALQTHLQMNSLQITLVVFDTQIVAVPNCAAVYLRINSEILLFSYLVGGGQMLEAAGVQHNITTRHFH